MGRAQPGIMYCHGIGQPWQLGSDFSQVAGGRRVAVGPGIVGFGGRYEGIRPGEDQANFSAETYGPSGFAVIDLTEGDFVAGQTLTRTKTKFLNLSCWTPRLQIPDSATSTCPGSGAPTLREIRKTYRLSQSGKQELGEQTHVAETRVAISYGAERRNESRSHKLIQGPGP